MATSTTKKTPAKGSKVFTKEEQEAMREYVAEKRKASAKGKDADGETDLLEKIAAMAQPDRGFAERIHAIVKAAVPGIESKTWYGMPAYAIAGKTVCFFQPAAKFKTRYSTLGFSDVAKLDDGNVWPNAYAIIKLTAADEKRITELMKKAAG